TMADVNVNALAEQAPAMAPPTHEQWFDLTKDTLRDALQITPVDNNNAFSSPPTPDVLIKFVNDLGYPKVGVVKRAHIDYAERMWEEFTQSIHTFIEDKKNLAQHTQGKKKATLIVIPSVRFTKLIIHHLQSKHKFHPRPGSPLHLPNEEPVLGYLKFSAKGTKREVFGMPIPNNLITADIQGEQYYNAYLEKVAKHQRYLAGEEVSDPDSLAPKPAKATKPKATKQSKPLAPKAAPVTKPAAAKAPKTTASRPPKPTPATTEPSKKDQTGKVVKKRTQKSSLQLVDEFVDEGVPVNDLRFCDEEADLQTAVEESLKDVHATHQGPLPPVVIREPESGKFQPLPECPTDQYVFQRRTSAPTEPSGHDESSSLYAELGLTDIETDSDEEVPGIDGGDQDEGQAGPNAGIQDEGQAGSNPGDAVVFQPQLSHVVHAGPNLEHMDVKVTDTLIQQNPEKMDKNFITTAYPNVQENLKLPTEDQLRLEEPASSAGTPSSLQNLDKEFSFTNQFLEERSQEDEPEKTNTESEVQSMVTVPIHQDTSSVPLMTTLVIDLTRIGELEQHMADLLQDNLALEERLEKHGSKLYKLENLDIPHQVSKAVDEIVTDAIDWAIQAPLKDRFRDLVEADMKEILHHRMWETKSYKAHEDHKNLYEALEKSMNRDHSDQLLTDLAEARRNKKKRHESPKTPLGSPPHQPPPPLPSAGPSGTLGASGAFGLSQLPPHLPPSTNQSDQSKGTAAPSSSKTAPSAEYTAWTTIDTRLRPSVSSTPDDLNMDDDSVPDAQVHSSDDEDIRNDHIPKVNLKHDWWKPLSEEDRPATPEPAWSIPSSDLPVLMHNWASALASTYAPPPENSLLAQTGNMATFMDWYCKKQGTTELTQKDLEGPAFEIVKVFHPDGQVIIQSDFFFNKDLEYLRYGSKGSRPALSISKMKATYYADVGLEQMVPDQLWIEEECKQRVEDFQLGIESYQTQLNLTKPRWDAIGFEFKHDFTVIDSSRAVTFKDKYGVQMIMRFNEIHKFSDGTLQQIDEALDYRVKEFKVNRMNPGLDTRFWTRTYVERSKEFMFAIQKWLKKRRIFRNLETFVGGRDGKVRESFLRSRQSWRDLPRDNSLVSVEVLRNPDDLQHSFRNPDACYHDPEKYEHAGLKVTTSHGGNTTIRMIWRFTVADDLK
ncbi:hypothetical protein Tco_1047180, partial [Tanacetum coccineum]